MGRLWETLSESCQVGGRSSGHREDGVFREVASRCLESGQGTRFVSDRGYGFLVDRTLEPVNKQNHAFGFLEELPDGVQEMEGL